MSALVIATGTLGVYCGEVHFPIPNREVKLTSADAGYGGEYVDATLALRGLFFFLNL